MSSNAIIGTAILGSFAMIFAMSGWAWMLTWRTVNRTFDTVKTLAVERRKSERVAVVAAAVRAGMSSDDIERMLAEEG